MNGHSPRIEVQGATEQNLRGLSCSFPRGALSVVTGPSGSGKSSLLFGVLYRAAIGRGAVKALSVTGLPPTVAVDFVRKARNVRETAATLSGCYDLLRALYLLDGLRHCPGCGSSIELHSADSIVQFLRSFPNHFISVLATHSLDSPDSIEALNDRGISRGWIDGRIQRLAELDPEQLGAEQLIVTDIITPQSRGREARVREAIAQANDGGAAGISFGLSEQIDGQGEVRTFALRPLCPTCGRSFAPLDSSQFDFSSTSTACEQCLGQGSIVTTSIELDGLSYIPEESCPACEGARVRPEVAAIELAGARLGSLLRGSFSEALPWALSLVGNPRGALVGKIAPALVTRLQLLEQLGVGHLPLTRSAATLSAGEAQRVRLAMDLAKPLGGLLYLIDEPTTGLHPRDVTRVIGACRGLVAKGSTVIAVEHDPTFITAADYIVELGPGSGVNGGTLVAAAPQSEFLAGDSTTAVAIRRTASPVPHAESPLDGGEIVFRGMHRYSLQQIDLRLPLRRLVAIAGVSGSGKTTALLRTAIPVLEYLLRHPNESGDALPDAARQLFKLASVSGERQIVAAIDASHTRPYLGARSTVASASGILSPLRELFARTIEARAAGLTAREFSFFSPSGWCERCHGRGAAPEGRIDRALEVPCPECHGARLSAAARAVRYRGKTLAELLELTIEEAAHLFRYVPRLRLILPRLVTMGLGYLRLSQSTRSLSRGEQQRLRLLPFIGRARDEGGTLLVFDEPTKGLHLDEVTKLIALLRSLVAQGNSVVVIEHNQEVLRHADRIIEFGPGAGADGGRIVNEKQNAQATR